MHYTAVDKTNQNNAAIKNLEILSAGHLLVQFLLSVDFQSLVALLLLANSGQILLGTFLQHILILKCKVKCESFNGF